ncbi:TspO/MBR family protein [Methylocella tundrae]|jgi:tryptophan-rich sensory protein|uniref:Putative tryptophan rich sensory protein: integral membrane protein n=1 Tax=Methylocella tundrae TaxID=227605 RepID=A0A4U8Z647_METTU|nr:TspO/MBR family protein [Methylocella tundrae]WPP04595.1 TspO/MBR family protein [Methylocella tundrae]VFU11021.1 putative tryptophan rich sensory protein: integral membrane protein [Methylocella tundrae]
MKDAPLLTGAARSLFRLVACFALCYAIAAIEGAATAPQISGWYATLAKPAWTPPNLAFPIAWTILYGLMAIALWRLWDRAPPSAARRRALILFLVQLALNASWSPVFFGLHAIWAGFAIILLLVGTLAATMWQSAKADRIAAFLLAPYLAWISFAAALNGAVALLNS